MERGLSKYQASAQRGYLAEERILETERGFCAVYGDTDGSSVTRGLGDAWDIITDMAIKLVPGGHPSYSLAEAAANAARAGQIAPDDVETITLSRPGVTALTGPIHPTDLIDMARSPAYFLAAGDPPFLGGPSWIAVDTGEAWCRLTSLAPTTTPAIIGRRRAHMIRQD